MLSSNQIYRALNSLVQEHELLVDLCNEATLGDKRLWLLSPNAIPHQQIFARVHRCGSIQSSATVLGHKSFHDEDCSRRVHEIKFSRYETHKKDRASPTTVL